MDVNRTIETLWTAPMSEWIGAASDPCCDPGLLDWLAVLGGEAVAAEVALNPVTSRPTVNWLSMHGSPGVVEAVALRD